MMNLHEDTRLLDKLLVQSTLFLLTSLSKMLEMADDVLFEHSNKKHSIDAISPYTLARSKICKDQDSISADFKNQLESNFSSIQVIQSKEKAHTLNNIEFDSLTLVQDDELDENIIIDSMVAKSKTVNEVLLSQLVTRLDKIIADKTIDSDNNPLRPRAICDAFQHAINQLNIDAKPRLVIYKLFEKQVIFSLTKLYKNINHSLAKAGILPTLSETNVIKQAEPIKEEKTLSQTLQQEQDSGTNVLAALKDILTDYNSRQSYNPVNLSHLETNQTNEAQPQTNEAAPQVNATPPQAIIDQNTLIQALSSIQFQNQQQFIAGNNNSNVDNIRNQIDAFLPTPDPVSSQTIGQLNDNIIDIISMLFNFILDDEHLPDEFKALIGRLQIPVLKVALIDEKFLSEGSHPARVLINEMGQSVIGWTNEHGSGLRDILSEIVSRIINDFENDTSIFKEELEKFHEFNTKYKTRVKLIEKRVKELEEGKAKNRTAEVAAIDAIEQLVGNISLPIIINKLMFEDWKQVLQLTYLRDGVNSKKWLQHLNTASELITSLFPAQSEQLKEDVESRLPEIIDNIKAGFKDIGDNTFDDDNLFSELKKLHCLAHEGTSTLLESEAEDNHDNEITQKNSPISNDSNGNAPSTESTVIEQEFEIKTELSSVDSEDEDFLDDEQYINQVENLQVGVWVKFHEKLYSHCKLAAFIESIDKYIFVNHSGRKVAEYTKDMLVQAFKNKQVFQLDESALFERALKSIVSNFREEKYQNDDTSV